MTKKIKSTSDPFCVRWSAIRSTETPCLREKCKLFMPIRDEQVRNDVGSDGFCQDELSISFLEDISLSLSVIADILISQNGEECREGCAEGEEEPVDSSKKEKIFGLYG